jgi:hypothetical protein
MASMSACRGKSAGTAEKPASSGGVDASLIEFALLLQSTVQKHSCQGDPGACIRPAQILDI